MNSNGNDSSYQAALHQAEVQALNFGYRWINDAAVRQQYLQSVQTMSKELRGALQSGVMTPYEAAKMANEMRNEIMEAARKRTSDIGRAKASSMKAKGLALDDLIKKAAKKKFDLPFDELTKGQQDELLMDIVDSAGRANKGVNAKMRRLGNAGRALWVFTIVVAVYNVGTAEDKADALGREVTVMGGGFAAGAASGAIAGLWLGPLGVAVGVAVGGTLGAIMSDRAYVQIRGQEDATVQSIIAGNTNMVSTDEEGIANALIRQCGIDMRMVSEVFGALSRDYSSDSDDVARYYIDKVQLPRNRTILHALRLDRGIRRQLVGILEGGWTSGKEQAQIRYLQSL
ncbi:MAG: hypothetical protein AAF958_05330 [Planctomycetota bacterium]